MHDEDNDWPRSPTRLDRAGHTLGVTAILLLLYGAAGYAIWWLVLQAAARFGANSVPDGLFAIVVAAIVITVAWSALNRMRTRKAAR